MKNDNSDLVLLEQQDPKLAKQIKDWRTKNEGVHKLNQISDQANCYEGADKIIKMMLESSSKLQLITKAGPTGIVEFTVRSLI